MASQEKQRRWATRSALWTALIAGAAALSASAAPANAQSVTMVAVAGQDCNVTGVGSGLQCGSGGTVTLPVALTASDANRPFVTSAPPGAVPVAKGQLWQLQPTGETHGAGTKFVYIINEQNGFALTNTPTFQQPPQPCVLAPFTHANAQQWLMGHVAAFFAPGAFFFSNDQTQLTVDATGDVLADPGGTTAWQITPRQAISKLRGVK